MLRIVHISDTHGNHRYMNLPDGDILVHSGDFSKDGEQRSVEDFFEWWTQLKHTNKVLVAGNHDICFDPSRYRSDHYMKPEWVTLLIKEYLRYDSMHHYLEHSSVNVWGLNIFGSPYTRKKDGVHSRYAFKYDSKDGSAFWVDIPKNTDILVTHGPAYGKLDWTDYVSHGEAGHVGCEALRFFVKERKPKLHLFGHIHEEYGIAEDFEDPTIYSNASALNGFNKDIMNSANVFDICPQTKQVEIID